MKIGLVCPYNLFKGGGVQECVLAMQAELARRGHEALIISPQPREYTGEVPDFVRLLGRATDMKSPFHTTAQVSVSVDMKEVNALLDSEKFDILHFHEPWVPLLSRQLLGRSEAKNIATFHAKLPDTMMSRTIERVITPYTKSVLKNLDGLSAVSEAAAEYVNGLTDRQVHIIPNGINLKEYKSIVRKPTKSIVYLGRLEKRKGVRYLIQAYKELSNYIDNVELIIAGDGPDRAKLEELVEELELKNVKFLGYIDNVHKRKLLSTAGVFCSPALYGESFGIVLLEAMATGIPIVAGDNPGYASVMKNRGMLSLVDPHDTANFARRLELLLFDTTLQRAVKEWADSYINQFDYTHVLDQYEKLYASETSK